MARTSEEILSNLSDFELIELLYMSRELLTLHASILITFFFGYLVVAFFVGKKLTLVQVSLLSIVYSAISFFSVLNIYIEAVSGARIGAHLGGFPENLLPTFVALGVLVSAWFLTIVYMFQTRRNDENA